jgi:RHS repeat-associated protein
MRKELNYSPNLVQCNFVHTDILGSYDVITNQNGGIVQNFSFDAWGQRRNPKTWTNTALSSPSLFSRGYTGHEHLDAFNLINMNGRVYDPLLARFLSPDNEIQSPECTQSYNRFSYCLNNPFAYTDPSGNNWLSSIWGAINQASIWWGNEEQRFGNWMQQNHINADVDAEYCYDIPLDTYNTPAGTAYTPSYDQSGTSGTSTSTATGSGTNGGSSSTFSFHYNDLNIVPFVGNSKQGWEGFSNGNIFAGTVYTAGAFLDLATVGSFGKAEMGFEFATNLISSFSKSGLSEAATEMTKLATQEGVLESIDITDNAGKVLWSNVSEGNVAGRAFFSGSGTEARAIEAGYQTLGETRAGQNLAKMTEGMKYEPGSQAYNWWARLSATYAKGVPGGSSVNVFLNNPSATGIWNTVEKPILEINKVKIIIK